MRGTLHFLILRMLSLGSQHGQGIARQIEHRSGNALIVDRGLRYPDLQRLEDRGWIRAKWGVSDNNRRARFCSITAAAQSRLTAEVHHWDRIVRAISLVLAPGPLAE